MSKGITSQEIAKLAHDVSLSPKSFPARMNLGIALGEAGQWKNALVQFQAADAILANNPEAIYDIGLVHMMMASLMQDHHTSAYYEQLDAAQRALERASKLKPELPNIHRHLGWLYRQIGDQESAIQQFRLAVKMDPASVVALNNLGTSLAEAEQYQEAEHWYEDALAIDSECVSCAINLASSLRSTGENVNAARGFKKRVLEQPDSPVAHLLYGMALALTHDQKDLASKELNSALARNPRLAVAHFYLGEIQREQQNVATAETEYRRAIEMAPGRADFLARLAVVLVGEQKLKEAKAALQEAVRLDPENSSLHFNLAKVLQRSGDPDGAAKEQAEMGRLIKENRNTSEVGMGLKRAIDNLRNGSISDAVRELQAVLVLNPNYPETNYYLGIALSQQGDAAGAIQAFQQALKRRPESAEFHYNFGICLWRYGQGTRAIEEFRRATTIRRDYSIAHCALGLALLHSGNSEEGKKEMAKARDFGVCAQ